MTKTTICEMIEERVTAVRDISFAVTLCMEILFTFLDWNISL